MKKQQIFFFFALAITLSSCVAQVKYTELQSKKNEFERQNESLKTKNEALETDLNEQSALVEKQGEDIARLKKDTTLMSSSLRLMTSQYDKINELNDVLMNKNSDLLSQTAKENKKLLEELNQKQADNIAKEDQLRKLQADIAMREENLSELTKSLDERKATVAELEQMLAQKDAAAEELRNKLSKALLGFKDKGLTVEEKNGKVYVSMEAKLLFPSGSTEINSEGKQALIDLAKAIEGEQDLDIIVEGHTDTDKMNRATSPKDNWELSVLRSTSVVKIMLANSSIDPTVLSAAGRGEFIPVDPSDKAKNRRIEIVLSPNLNELMELIQN